MKAIVRTVLLSLATAFLMTNAMAQVVYDSILGSIYRYGTPDSDEEADKVELASIEHPIIQVRVGISNIQQLNSTLEINIYSVDPKTGLPGNLLTSGSTSVAAGTGIYAVNVNPVQLSSNVIWVGYRCTPYSPEVAPYIGFTPSVGKSEEYIAYKDVGGIWHLHYYWNVEGTIPLQVIMGPK